MNQKIDFAEVDKILELHGNEQRNLITILQSVQAEHRYLPREILEYIAKKTGISLAKIYSVATFYENFSLDPKGKYIIKICDGTACHVRKSIPILEKVRSVLGVSEEKPTTEDMMFTVETVSCLGACGLAPVMTINDKVYPAMTPEKATELLQAVREGEVE